MLLVPLGTNGFFSTGARQTMSFLALADGTAVLLDAGTGVARLLDPSLRERLATCETLDILLTHYHLDHVAGLAYLSAVWPGGAVRIHAPAPPLVDGDPSALERLIGPPLFPKGLYDFGLPLEIRRYAADSMTLAGSPVRLRRQDHPGGSVGVRWGDLAYCTDCRIDEGSAAFVDGVDLLLHEVWVTAAEEAAGSPREGHSTVEEVAELAARAAVGRLAPVHHRPGRTDEELAFMRRRLADLSGVEVIEAREGEVLTACFRPATDD